ncbi:putative Unc104-like kinesin [Trypanosoma rangeli]|uniref:Putative Unc104-like kinesin n=1 Tax=Trypanosoma rangeli TaxID=5698 RepID=A0A3R7MDX7_TRYRA|nr:putative Unc104-like kinesin [Trypanosoma rangeli]RNF04050.1 putative Unc104-like kinesin [Trypanosoma rangeli]|eukprot:RNF04050.1 putative Unc104-like kinesin [Trypanosoma rangeli]
MMGEVGATVTCNNEGVLNNSEEGIIYRLCQDMYQEMQNRSFTSPAGETISWEVHVFFVEVYCEKISSLLNRSTPGFHRDEVIGNEIYFFLTDARRVPVTNTVVV